MSKKPSERINEIYLKQYYLKYEGYTKAIMQYLDEQYEQQKPCEEVVCGKCGFSGQIDGNGECWSSRCTDIRETF